MGKHIIEKENCIFITNARNNEKYPINWDKNIRVTWPQKIWWVEINHIIS